MRMKLIVSVFLLITIPSTFYSFLIFETPVLKNVNPVQDDICSDSISLGSINFNFFDETYNSLWLCNNGILAFTFNDTSFVPDPFPIEGNTLIAPFWADIDNSGDVSATGDENANSISWEIFTQTANLNKVNELLSQTVNLKRDFDAKWVFVATWYKVGYFDQETNLLNTFQVVLTCDDNQNGVCFCLFAYEDIQWTNSSVQESPAQAGFNDGTEGGRHEDLPKSRTPEIRNLPLMSNVGKNGLFVYELSSSLGCTKQVEPYFANMFFEKQNFRLNNVLCGGKFAGSVGATVQVLFMGKSFNRTVIGNIIENRRSVEGVIPFWGKGEMVHVGVIRDGVFDITTAMTMYFIHETSLKPDDIELKTQEVVEANGILRVDIEWDETHFDATRVAAANGKIALKVIRVNLPPNGLRGPFVMELIGAQFVENQGGKAIVDIGPQDGAVFLQLDYVPDPQQIAPDCTMEVSFNDCSEDPLTSQQVAFTRSLNFDCSQWVASEESITNNNQAESWITNLNEFFGCPVNVGSRPGMTDADFARQEAENGLIGWRYDPCCGVQTSDFGHHDLCIGGEQSGCPLNPGSGPTKVDFCIQSPSMLVQELDTNNNLVQLAASNQCCYSDGGSLIERENQYAGSMKKSSLNADNFLEFYLTEIPPRKYCTRQQYYEHRPKSTGDYETRMIIINWGDPHIVTFDGLQYTFNGLGVYMLTKTLDTFPVKLQMQVSTRRIGNGTVFSGCSLRDSSSSLQFHVSNNNDVSLSIGGTEIDISRLATLDMNGVEYSRNNISTEFNFKLIDSDFIIRVLVSEAGLVNFAISPPFELEGNLEGLLGNFDGEQENDLTSRDGRVVPITSTLDVIDIEFGVSWEVAQEDWLFSGNVAINIREDIATGSPFTPVYTPQFQSQQLRQAAEQICGDDEACLLDVSMTGDISFAANSVEMRERIESVEILNEAALTAHRNTNEDNTDEEEEQTEKLSPVAKGFSILGAVLISLVLLLVVCCFVPYIAYGVVRRMRKDTNEVAPEDNGDVFEFDNLKWAG